MNWLRFSKSWRDRDYKSRTLLICAEKQLLGHELPKECSVCLRILSFFYLLGSWPLPGVNRRELGDWNKSFHFSSKVYSFVAFELFPLIASKLCLKCESNGLCITLFVSSLWKKKISARKSLAEFSFD